MFINCSSLKSIRDGLVWMVAGLSYDFEFLQRTVDEAFVCLFVEPALMNICSLFMLLFAFDK